MLPGPWRARLAQVTPLRCAVVAAALALAGCGQQQAGAPPDLTGQWELVELVRDGEVRAEPGGGRATLTADDGTVSGTSFCNSFSGSYRLDGDALSVRDLGGTEMACAEDLMAAETAYLDALRLVDLAGTSDGYLVLSGPGVELRFRPVEPVPASELVGTRWTLETLLEGEVASSTTGELAVLLLAEDGAMTASTGCRELAGNWSLEGDVLRLSIASTEPVDCPPEVAQQDGHVAEVLGGEVQASVEGQSLTLTRSSGLGLVYRG